ncbi:MAG: TATA-box-binding protein [Methanospirillum sp.]
MNSLAAPIGQAGPAPHLSLTVRNIVASVKVADVLNLDDLARVIPGADYDKRRFSGLVYRRTSPKFAALVFTSGKVNLVGVQHPDAVAPALAALLEALRTAGAALAPDPRPRIVNLVASGNLDTGVSLPKLAVALDLENIEYEPEVFPGLVYRSNAGGVALIFTSGAMIIAGALSIHQAQAVSDEVWHLVDRAGAWMRT